MKDYSDFDFISLANKDVTLDNVWRDERIWEVNRSGIYTTHDTISNPSDNFVLICPGGAYRKLNPVNEGVEYVRWLNSLGVAAGILIYSLPNRSGTYAPFEDMKKAMSFLKNNLNFKRVGVMGFSAGGHLAAMSECNFMITVSPVISMHLPWAHINTRQNLLGLNATFNQMDDFSADKISTVTNNAFLVHAQDDPKAHVMHSLLFYHSLIAQNIPTSMHLLPTGGHPPRHADYKHDLENWLTDIKII